MGKKKNYGLKIIVAFLVAILLCVAGFIGYTYVQRDISGKDGSDYDYTLNIEAADFQYQVAQKLMSNKIILNDTLWCYWMDKHYPDLVFINGEYNLNSSMSYDEIAQKLQNPDVSHKTVTVCIPEGYNVFDIADTMEKNGICSREDFLNACKDKSDYDYDFLNAVTPSEATAYQLEGYLFPATYDLGENTDAKDVVSTMLEVFDGKIKDSWIDYCDKNYITLNELITIASIVEKETLGEGVAENIASVFMNRLNVGHKLQSDVTIDYGNALRENGFDDNTVTSYNTYKCDGLPSGPICCPGVANIDAVINHNDTDYFYFFSYNNGDDFYFTDSYDDFQTNWNRLKHTNEN